MKQLRLLGVAVAMSVVGVALPFVVLSRQSSPTLSIAPTSLAKLPSDESAIPALTAPAVSSAPFHLKVDLSDRVVRLQQGETSVRTYPIAIGQLGWDTPIGEFQVAQKIRNPHWINPLTDEWVAADDPANPLGGYWIGFWTDGRDWVGFHGTPDSGSVGSAVSHGCIRMHTEHIQELFEVIDMNTAVEVVL